MSIANIYGRYFSLMMEAGTTPLKSSRISEQKTNASATSICLATLARRMPCLQVSTTYTEIAVSSWMQTYNILFRLFPKC